MKFYELWYEFSIANSAKASLETYLENYDDCVNHKLEIISCDKNIALNMPILKDIMSIQNIISIFEYPNLSFFSPRIVKDMMNGQRAALSIDYSISFESNTARYVHDYLETGEANRDFINILHTFLDNNYNLDPMFYIIENFSKGNKTKEFYDNLVSIKKLMTCDMNYYKETKKIKSIFNDEEINLIVRRETAYLESEFSEVIHVAREQQLIMKIILLAITIGRYKYSKNEELQFKYLIRFMAKKLKTIFLRELTIAFSFFDFENNKNNSKLVSETEKYKFFNRLNGQNKNIFFDDIENMAWDFTLARQLEMYFSSKPNPEADFFIPFLFTFDKGLSEVIKMFYCKDFLIFHKEKRTIPIAVDNLDFRKIKKYGLESYFTEEAHIDRLNSEDVNLKEIYEELELEIIKVRKLK